MRAPKSVRLDVRLANAAAVGVELLARKGRVVGATRADGKQPLRLELRQNLRVLQRCLEPRRELREQILWRAGGRGHAEPDVEIEILEAGFLHGRHLRQ